jgi:drug/metabolite transporter (DMT)-like permease
VALTALSQVLLKMGANRGKGSHPLFLFLNVFTIVAYLLFFSVTLLNLYAYKVLPIKISVTILPFTYILVGIFSYLFLRERLEKRQLIGALIIIVGIVIFNLNGL